MRRLLSLTLVLGALGCGGGGGRRPADPPAVSVLGSAALDLAVGGGFAQATSMVGTGETRGSLTIEDASPGQVGVTAAHATLPRPTVVNNQSLAQELFLRFAHPEALAVGTRVVLDGVSNAAEYREDVFWVEGPIAGDGVTFSWRSASGTVEVTGLEGRNVTLRLVDVVLTTGMEGSPSVVTLSGAVSGTIVPPSI